MQAHQYHHFNMIQGRSSIYIVWLAVLSRPLNCPAKYLMVVPRNKTSQPPILSHPSGPFWMFL